MEELMDEAQTEEEIPVILNTYLNVWKRECEVFFFPFNLTYLMIYFVLRIIFLVKISLFLSQHKLGGLKITSCAFFESVTTRMSRKREIASFLENSPSYTFTFSLFI